MKKRKNFCYPVLLWLLLSQLFIISCSEDDPSADGKGRPLPEGKYPLRFTVGMEGMVTRAEGMDTWTGGEGIGVRIGEDGEVGKYTITSGTEAGFSAEPAEPEKPLYWRNTLLATVTAWYPSEKQGNISLADQSKSDMNFKAIDFLKAEYKNASYDMDNPIELNFTHQMAKVKYTLKHGDGVNEDDIKSATVSICGYTSATFENGTLAGTYEPGQNEGWIKPHVEVDGVSNETWLVPQDMTGKKFIKVQVNGSDFYYTPADNEANLESGIVYTYNITVKRDGLKVTVSQSAVWEQREGFQSDMEETEEYKLYVSYDANAYEEFSVTDKSGHQILTRSATNTYSLSADGCIIKYKIKSSLKPPYRRDGAFGGYATLTARQEDGYIICEINDVSSDVSYSLEASSSGPCEGDYYYTDNTYSTLLLDTKENCSGVVFYVGVGPGDNVSNYGDKLEEIHGYVLAANHAGEDRPDWCTTDYQKELIGTYENPDAWCGYKNTQTILEYIKEKHPDLTLSDDNYTQIYRATTYNKNEAPKGTSGWYLGSAAQMKYALQIADKLENPINNCGSTTHWRLWGTSTERDVLDESKGYGIYDIEKGFRESWKSWGEDPRPILTF